MPDYRHVTAAQVWTGGDDGVLVDVVLEVERTDPDEVAIHVHGLDGEEQRETVYINPAAIRELTGALRLAAAEDPS